MANNSPSAAQVFTKVGKVYKVKKPTFLNYYNSNQDELKQLDDLISKYFLANSSDDIQLRAFEDNYFTWRKTPLEDLVLCFKRIELSEIGNEMKNEEVTSKEKQTQEFVTVRLAVLAFLKGHELDREDNSSREEAALFYRACKMYPQVIFSTYAVSTILKDKLKWIPKASDDFKQKFYEERDTLNGMLQKLADDNQENKGLQLLAQVFKDACMHAPLPPLKSGQVTTVEDEAKKAINIKTDDASKTAGDKREE